MNVFSSAMKFLFEVPRIIFDGDSFSGPVLSGISGSGSSTDSPRSFARALNVLKMAPPLEGWRSVKKCFLFFYFYSFF